MKEDVIAANLANSIQILIINTLMILLLKIVVFHGKANNPPSKLE